MTRLVPIIFQVLSQMVNAWLRPGKIFLIAQVKPNNINGTKVTIVEIVKKGQSINQTFV